MITVRHTGPDLQALAAQIGNVPKTLIPYPAATALTRCASYAAKTAIPDEMRRVFDRPTSFVLNSLRIEPATKDNLVARVAVKNERTGSGPAPENPLLPQVEGGARGSKGLENALRYAGVLRSGQFAVPGAGTTLDERQGLGCAHHPHRAQTNPRRQCHQRPQDWQEPAQGPQAGQRPVRWRSTRRRPARWHLASRRSPPAPAVHLHQRRAPVPRAPGLLRHRAARGAGTLPPRVRKSRGRSDGERLVMTDAPLSTLDQWRERLSGYIAAEARILRSQEYSIGSRGTTARPCRRASAGGVRWRATHAPTR